MRHRCAFRKLSRNSEQRARMLRSLATALFTHERITTTVARGKELRRYADKLITLAKRQTPAGSARLQGLLYTCAAAEHLLGELVNRYRERAGGYTRVLRAGPRERDKVPLSIVELVDNPWDMRKTFARYSKGISTADCSFAQMPKLRTLTYPQPYRSLNRPLLK